MPSSVRAVACGEFPEPLGLIGPEVGRGEFQTVKPREVRPGRDSVHVGPAAWADVERPDWRIVEDRRPQRRTPAAECTPTFQGKPRRNSKACQPYPFRSGSSGSVWAIAWPSIAPGLAWRVVTASGIVSRHAGQRDLSADETGPKVVPLLVDQVGEGQSRSILIGLGADGAVQCVAGVRHQVLRVRSGSSIMRSLRGFCGGAMSVAGIFTAVRRSSRAAGGRPSSSRVASDNRARSPTARSRARASSSACLRSVRAS